MQKVSVNVDHEGNVNVNQEWSEHWSEAFENYSARLHLFGAAKKQKATCARLTSLDTWYRDELPEKLQENGFISLQEIVDVTEWKMTRFVAVVDFLLIDVQRSLASGE